MMTLDEAIKHCEDVSFNALDKDCVLEHKQLKDWLEDYKDLKKIQWYSGDVNPEDVFEKDKFPTTFIVENKKSKNWSFDCRRNFKKGDVRRVYNLDKTEQLEAMKHGVVISENRDSKDIMNSEDYSVWWTCKHVGKWYPVFDVDL